MRALVLLLPAMILAACYGRYKDSPAKGEGHGVNLSSRKYYEYLRQHDPSTGRIPEGIHFASRLFASRLPKNGDRDLNWTARGPYNKGGRTRALAIDVTNENILLAGAVSGGIWRSVNGGTSWTKCTAPDQIHSISCIAQDTRPGHEDTWYAGTGEEFYGVVSGTSFSSLFSGDGMFKSTDGGITWQAIASTSSGTPHTILDDGTYDFVWNIVPDPSVTDTDVVLAAVYNGIIRSTDGGDSWQQVLGFSASGSEFVDLLRTPDGVWYATMGDNATTGGGFFRSEDGIAWTEIAPVLPQISNLRRTVMCHNPQNANEVYFLGESINNGSYPIGHFLYKYTYVSGDGTGEGGLWENRTDHLPDEPCELYIGVDFDFATFRTQFSYDICIAHHPTQADVLFIGGVNIHRSDNAFATDAQRWIGGYRCNVEAPVFYVYPNHHPDQHGFVFSPSNPNVMYNFNDGGIYRTDNCLADSVAWVDLNNGFITTQFYTVAMEQGDAATDFVFGGMQDNGTWLTHTSENTTAWKEVHADDGSYGALPLGRQYIISSSQQGRIFKKTIDASGQLTGTERIDPENGPTALFINPLLLDPVNHDDLFIAGNKTIWYLPEVSSIPVTGNYTEAMDNDAWIAIGPSTVPITAGSISCLDKPISDNSIIYYGTTQGRAYRLDDCYGETPVRTTITGDDFPANSYVSCITANDLDPNEVLLSFSNYNRKSIFHSTDGGTTWADVGGNLEENEDGTGAGPGVYWVEIYPTDPVIYFAGTSAGLFSTTELNGSATVWQMEGASTIGNVVINMVRTRPSDGTIAVATHGNGVYTAQLPPIEALSVAGPDGTLPAGPHPNPFTDHLMAPLLPGSETVQFFTLYGMSGNKVFEISMAATGDRPVRITPPADLPAGTYLYTLRRGEQLRSGKLLHR